MRDFFEDVLKEHFTATRVYLPERSEFELWREARSRSVDLCIESPFDFKAIHRISAAQLPIFRLSEGVAPIEYE